MADRIGSRWLAASGLALACVGLVLISQLNAQSPIFEIVWRMLVAGAGQALFQSPNNSALMGSAPRERQGVASGFLATGRVMGQSVSVALAGVILVSGQHLPVNQVMALQDTFTSAFHATFVVCAVIAALSVFTSLVRGKEERKGVREGYATSEG